MHRPSRNHCLHQHQPPLLSNQAPLPSWDESQRRIKDWLPLGLGQWAECKLQSQILDRKCFDAQPRILLMLLSSRALPLIKVAVDFT